MKIDPEIRVGELLERYPETLDVFTANGFQADSRENLLTQVEPILQLQTALQIKHINQSLFISMLEEKIVEEIQRPLVTTELPPEGKLDFLVYIVCPLKHLFKDGLEQVLQTYRQETGKTFNCFVPMGCGGADPYEDIWKEERIEDFPDLVVSVGFDNLFKQSFLDNYVKQGYFKTGQHQPLAPVFAECGLGESDGWHTIYGIFPYIVMVDTQKLSDVPLPRRWQDLLNPVYRGQIMISGSLDELPEVLLLNYYQSFGGDGVKQLAANVKDVWHASKMAKIAGSGHPDGTAIYVIPWFFATTNPHKGRVKLIWPEDGALVSPLYFLAKQTKLDELKVVIDFVTGVEFGQKAAEIRFPMLNPAVDNHLPPKAGFKWLGWDYIKSVNLEYLIDYTRQLFRDEFKKEKGV